MQKLFHFFTLIKTKMSKKNVIVSGILISSSHVQYIKQVIVCLHFVYLIVTLFWVLAIFKCFIYALSSRYPPRAFGHVTKYPSAETECFFPFFKPYFHYDKYSFKI